MGKTAIETPGFRLVGSTAFRIQEYLGTCTDPLKPGDSCQVSIEFCPVRAKTYKGMLTFTNSLQVVPIKGSGVAAKY